MRLIDADALKKELRTSGIVDTYGTQVLFKIDHAPTIDAVPVVRCGECIHRIYVDMGDEIGAVGGCGLYRVAMPSDNFCSYGERKDKEGE